jgi:hypothetical protein
LGLTATQESPLSPALKDYFIRRTANQPPDGLKEIINHNPLSFKWLCRMTVVNFFKGIGLQTYAYKK